jgi:hypothetical protein
MLLLASWILTHVVLKMDTKICEGFFETSRLRVQLAGYFLFLHSQAIELT